MKFKLYKHQQDFLDWSKTQTKFALWGEMGVGKTVMLLAHVERGYAEFRYDCLLIIAPKGVYTNWPNKEIPTHLSIPYQCFIWRSGMTAAQQKKMWHEMDYCRNKLRVVVMNIEALVSKQSMDFAAKVLKTYQCMFAIDESTTIKTPTSSRTNKCIDLSELTDCDKCIMTGSPITKGPYDLYSQAYFLDPSYLGFTSFLAYRNYFAEILTTRITSTGERKYLSGAQPWSKGVRQQYEKVIEYKNLDVLQTKLAPWSFRVLKKDCLDLPPKIYMRRDVEMTKEQEKAYHEMSEMWLMEVESGTVTATIALTRLMKLHTILCGFVKNDAGEVIDIPSNRASLLLDIVQERSSKVIIWCNYQRDISTIRTTLYKEFDPSAIVEFHGGTSPTDRELAKVRFQEDDTCQVWLGTPKAGSMGNTLTKGHLMVYYSYDFNREHRWQSEDRAHRIGLDSPLTIIDLVVPGSIDEVILNAHKETSLIASEVVDKARNFLRTRQD